MGVQNRHDSKKVGHFDAHQKAASGHMAVYHDLPGGADNEQDIAHHECELPSTYAASATDVVLQQVP